MSSRPPSSILIVRLSAIGDVVHALPFLDALRQQLPQARIGWIVEELSAPLLEHHPQLDTLYVLPRRQWRGKYLSKMRGEIAPFFRQLRSDKWDAAFDLQGLSKSAGVAFLSGARIRVGFRGSNAREVSPLLNNVKVRPLATDMHVVEQNLRLLEGIGLRVPDCPPRGMIGILESEKEAMRARLREAGWRGEPLLALNPGAGWESKRWPAAYYGKLGALLGSRTGTRALVLWGPKEEPMRDEIARHIDQAVIAPKTSVRELAVLISLCSLFVGGDTGASHMAGLLGVPVISIWGGSDPQRNCPWPKSGANAAGVFVQRDDFDCVPCWKTECPLPGEQRLQCLVQMTPEFVAERAAPWLDERFPGA